MVIKCKRCDNEFRDGAQCTACQGHFDFPCAGISEAGYRKLGDRKNNWKCSSCKNAATSSPLNVPSGNSNSTKSPTSANLDSIALELKRLTAQMSSLPALMESVKSIEADLRDLKSMKKDITDLKLLKPAISEMKASIEFTQHSIEALTGKLTSVDQQVQSLLKTKDDMSLLQQQFQVLQETVREQEQRARLNNIEIKGVPIASSENLFTLVSKIGDLIQCPLSKAQINYVARVPMRNDKLNKSIIISIHNRYLKDDFVAAAKKRTITSTDLGLKGEARIFVNDHLTLENKMLLNKTKVLAKGRNFAFVWVKGCKIFIRKNPTSPVITIKSDADLKKLSN